MNRPIRVLIVEDSEDDALLLVQELRREGYDPTFERVDTPEAMAAALEKQVWDTVLCDYNLPRFSVPHALLLLKKYGLDLPFIIVSGSIGEDIAVAAMKTGAHDYIMKANLTRLIPAIERELREAEVRREYAQAEKTIQRMAFYDTLTGLPNRNMLYDRLLNAIRTGSDEGKPLALLLMDLDRFKEINDTLGHHRGDLLLQQVGSRLQGALRPTDIVARLGGDEFAMLLSLAESTHAEQVAKKVQQALEPPFIIEGLPIAVEVSIGIALYPDHGGNPDSLMQRADVAMYAAKKSGLGYVIYAPEFDLHSPRKLALMGELRRAIEENQLFLHYQPKIDLKTRRVIGVEALARWKHPEHGFIPPDQFIPPAERTGLIKDLTLWVLNAAQRQCQNWHQGGCALGMCINFSARNLQDPGLPRRISEMMSECKVPPGTLCVEITETAIMDDPKRALEFIRHLKPKGVRFSIDDFGMGYSSLGSLKDYPVDEIKVDRAFVMNMMQNKGDATIVRMVVDLAHNLGLQVVAEGVENQETYDRLVEMGCDAAQGYYMCKPIPAEGLTCWLSESPWGLSGAA